jgi:hypothetical protein
MQHGENTTKNTKMNSLKNNVAVGMGRIVQKPTGKTN